MPLEDCPDNECVPQIVDACLGTVNVGTAKEPCEGTVHAVVDEPRAGQRGEEAWRAPARMGSFALLCIKKERAHDGFVQDYLAGLAKLALADDEELVGPINIAGVEANSLANAHAGRGYEAEERLVGRAPERQAFGDSGWHFARGLKQARDLLGRVDRGCRTAAVPRQEVARGNLMARINQVKVLGEPAHHRQLRSPP